MIRPLAKFAIMVSLTLIFATGSFAQKVKWKKYETEYFSVMLPGTPTKEVEPGETAGAATYKYSLESNEAIIMVAVTNTGIEMTEPHEMAEIAMESFGETIQLESVASGDWLVSGQVGVFAHYEKEPGGMNGEYHVVAKGDKLYQVVIFSDQEAIVGSKSAKKLVKSFKIK